MSNIKLTNDVKIDKSSLDLGTLLNGSSIRWADVGSVTINQWVTNFGNKDNQGKTVGYNLQVEKGLYLVIGKYDVTGANADAGIRLYMNEQSSEEVFSYRGYNVDWRHTITLVTVVECSEQSTLRLGYYLNSAGTITNPRLTVIPINKLNNGVV